GYNDFRDMLTEGRLRALMVVAPERLEGLDVPTAAEAGYPEVDIVNWRGLVAPAGIDRAEQEELIEITTEMVDTEHWANVVDRNRWNETVLTGDEFGEFLRQEQDRVNGILQDLGLA